MSLIACKSNKVVQEGLKFAIALLEGGNEHVQQMLYDFLVESRESTLFEALRERINRGMDEPQQVGGLPALSMTCQLHVCSLWSGIR